MITMKLSYPPSVNHYWMRAKNGGMYVSSKGKAFKGEVFWYVNAKKIKAGYTGPVSVEIDVYPPDNRKRDLDNINKALLDALGAAGIYLDDSQIVRLVSTKYQSVPNGQVIVRVKKAKLKTKEAA